LTFLLVVSPTGLHQIHKALEFSDKPTAVGLLIRCKIAYGMYESRAFRRQACRDTVDREVERLVDTECKQDIWSRQSRKTNVEAGHFRRRRVYRAMYLLERGVQWSAWRQARRISRSATSLSGLAPAVVVARWHRECGSWCQGRLL